MPHERRVSIASDADIVTARQVVREMARELRMTAGDLTLVATAVSEIARNIVSYAKRGEITIAIVEQAGRRGVQVVARDQGPGIPDVGLALTDGYSTGRSLGLGLPGARRLMDEFAIESEVGKGTTVSMTKWERQA
jgi:serine/threonine-protein kinase RsbT